MKRFGMVRFHVPPKYPSAILLMTRAAAVLAAALLCSACSSVPGETMTSLGAQREVRDRVLALARSAGPQCKAPKISTTEMVEVHPDGRAAAEVWTVEQCGRRVNYVVSFPVKKGAGFSVRAER